MRRLALAAALLSGGCSAADRCSEQLVETLPAPGGGGLAAFRVIRDCGGSADLAAAVKIGREFDGPDRADTVFVADSDHGAAAVAGQAVRVHALWRDRRRLTVTYARGARAFRAEPEARGVAIRYAAEAVSPRN